MPSNNFDFSWALTQAEAQHPEAEWLLDNWDYGRSWAIASREYENGVILATDGCNVYGPEFNANERKDKTAWLNEALQQIVNSPQRD